jgi:hypothetical protein
MVAKRALSALSKIGIIIAIAVAFIFGLAGTVYLSLRSPEVKVPDVKGKDRVTAESALDDAGLHMRVRATRFNPEAQPDTILDQSPQKDEVIKVGQTVAVVVARGAKEGESVPSAPVTPDEKKPEDNKTADNQNTSTTSAATNQNENQNKPKRTRNSNNTNNRNANNSNGNRNANANARNANNGNAGNGNASSPDNRNTNPERNTGNSNRRAPVISTPSTPPFVPSGPPRMR